LDRDLIARQSDALAHRGPDDRGLWMDPTGRVALANRRLAIIDLSSAGHMPMGDESGRVWITFNGEIYNFAQLRTELERRGHIFCSRTDTEVVLTAYLQWGTSCLERLNGMFAFAIFDGREGGLLFLARDRAGEKPLYYAQTSDGFSFASELTSLMADPALPRRLDLDALNSYLTYGYIGGEMCILRDVRKLPAANAATLDLSSREFKVWRYWALPDSGAPESGDINELTARFDALLCGSVRNRLVADVPVGILLSGGIDSSLVTAAAARVARKLQTFTITFPGYGHFDEGPYARRIAAHFGAEHTELSASEIRPELVEQLATHLDEPHADTSLLPTYIVAELTHQHVPVALSGDGGDELFGGYDDFRRKLRLIELQRDIPQPVRHCLRYAAIHMPVGLKGRNYLASLSSSKAMCAAWASVFDPAARTRVLAPAVCHELDSHITAPEEWHEILMGAAGSALEQLSRLYFQTYLEGILTKVDRASMAVSLEVRSPLLDRNLVEFTYRDVPSRFKLADREKKILPRHLAKRLLPAGLDLDRKHGFSPPMHQWMRDAWQPFVREVLSGVDEKLFNRRHVKWLVDSQTRGYSNSTRIFALLMFELWRRQHNVSF
jgi:asparagine synthase (glutamine-hydrolysing)